MLGGLARWLRAMGHAAAFEPSIDDGDIVLRLASSGEFLLTSDAPLLERRAFKDGVRIGDEKKVLSGLFVPRHAPVGDQLVFVVRELELPILAPRCMACGGALDVVSAHEVEGHVPERSLRAFDEFFRCAGCDRVFWHGRHWDRIEKERARIGELVASSADAR